MGIDVGAIDLVIQIAAPLSVASGIQRVGRACHQVGATPKGHFYAKHRHDLLVASIAADCARHGWVERSHPPRLPLDVLAQQIIGIVACGDISVMELACFGIVTPRLAQALSYPGGFGGLYPVLKQLEARGRLRLGEFIEGEGFLQFASAGDIWELRDLSEVEEGQSTYFVAATDPANAFGLTIPWPQAEHREFGRSADMHLLIDQGELLAGYRSKPKTLWVPEFEAQAFKKKQNRIANLLGERFEIDEVRQRVIANINGNAIDESWSAALVEAGFRKSSEGFIKRLD